jgi:hypothetical protein
MSENLEKSQEFELKFFNRLTNISGGGIAFIIYTIVNRKPSLVDIWIFLSLIGFVSSFIIGLFYLLKRKDIYSSKNQVDLMQKLKAPPEIVKHFHKTNVNTPINKLNDVLGWISLITIVSILLFVTWGTLNYLNN